MFIKTLKSLTAMMALVAATSGQATVVGATANVSFYFPNTSSLYCSNGAQTIGAGVEYPSSCSGFGPVGIDIGEGTITVTHSNSSFASGDFNGFSLDILGIDLGSVSYVGGSLGVTNASVIGGDIWLNFADQLSGTANFRFTEAGGGNNNVPEPASLGLMGLALAALGVSRRKSASKA